MPWAQLDDQFHSHRKFLAAGLEATGLYARALSYCAASLTDGFVPGSWITLHIGTKRSIAQRLADVEAWEPIRRGATVELETREGETVEITATEDGYVIPDYLLYNPSKAEHEARQRQRRAAGAKGARRRWGGSDSHGDTHSGRHGESYGDTHGDTHGPPRASAHARPRPTPTPSSEREDFVSSLSAAAAEVLTILRQIDKPGYANGKLRPERLTTLLETYPDRDHLAEARALADWETHGAGADERTKDGIARFRNWLKRAEPRKEVSSHGEGQDQDLSAYVRA